MTPTSFNKRNLAQQVAEQLSQMINQRQWIAGRRLPAVRELAGQFGVSANTAHAALRLLADKGVVGLRPRQGAFVEGRRRAGGGAAAAAGARNQIGVLWSPPPGDIAFDTWTSERDNWTQRIIRSADLALHEAGFYVTSLGYLGSDGFAGMLPRVRQMHEHLAGVLLYSATGVCAMTEELDRLDIPWVSINAVDRRSTHNFVTADNLGDCTRLGKCLVKSGVRRLLILCTPVPLNVSGSEKILGMFQGFIDSLVPTSGIEVAACESWTEAAGYQTAARKLAEPGVWYDAIFTTGDMLSMGAIRACRERGLRVPEDIGVIGTTGLQLAEFTQPPLTVIAQPMEEMGRNAAHMLVEMAREGVRRMVGRRIPGRFVIRQSIRIPDELEAEFADSNPAGEVVRTSNITTAPRLGAKTSTGGAE